MLQDRIKEYQLKNMPGFAVLRDDVQNEIAKDIADICDAELKAKLDNIKYLDRNKVEKIMGRYIDYDGFTTTFKVDGAINAICNLAISTIDKDRIMRVLKEYADDEGYLLIENFNNKGVGYFAIEQIANEIIDERAE